VYLDRVLSSIQSLEERRQLKFVLWGKWAPRCLIDNNHEPLSTDSDEANEPKAGGTAGSWS